MKYNITEEDKLLVQQADVHYKYRLFIVDKSKNVLDEVTGVSDVGSYSIDSESKIRRICSFTLLLDNCYKDTSMEKRLFSWIGYSFQLQIGIYNYREDDYKWYDCGYYLITEANTSYNAIDNSLNLNLSDWYASLDGTRNGQIGGAPTILIPNYDKDKNPITIKNATEGLLRDETTFKDYIVDDIGEFYGMPNNNPDYEEYRAKNPLWNQLPYDLEYEVGCTVGDIFSEICDLYPNCQMYFDTYGNFCFNLIPSCEYDPVVMDNEYIQSILLSDSTENVDYDINSIKNVTEVFGKTYEIDRYSTECTIDGDTYTITLEEYDAYHSDYIAFIPNETNTKDMKLRINELDVLPIYNEYTEEFIEEGILEAGKTYVLKLKYYNGSYIIYYLGQYQPHAICILTNNAEDTTYTKSYFAKKYNCDERNVILRVETDSPFVVQKLGEILDVKTGDTFDNILSDHVARENAIYYNRKSSSVYDTVTISTKMIPFLDTNIKVEYKKQQEQESKIYIVKNIDNANSMISTITMYRFYPLYYG